MRGSLGLQSLSTIPEKAVCEFETAIEAVALAYMRFGLPRSLVTDIEISLVHRSSGNEANGVYDRKSNTIRIFYPQLNAPDLSFSLAHEVAHKLWYLASKEDRELWIHMKLAMGRKLPESVIEFNLQRAAQGKRTPLWFWYKNNIGSDLNVFNQYLHSINYTPAGFPRTYANASAEEAWADVVASMAMGKSHNRNLMAKSGSLPIATARKIIDHVALSTKEPAKGKFQPTRSNLRTAGRM